MVRQVREDSPTNTTVPEVMNRGINTTRVILPLIELFNLQVAYSNWLPAKKTSGINDSSNTKGSLSLKGYTGSVSGAVGHR